MAYDPDKVRHILHCEAFELRHESSVGTLWRRSWGASTRDRYNTVQLAWLYSDGTEVLVFVPYRVRTVHEARRLLIANSFSGSQNLMHWKPNRDFCSRYITTCNALDAKDLKGARTSIDALWQISKFCCFEILEWRLVDAEEEASERGRFHPPSQPPRERFARLRDVPHDLIEQHYRWRSGRIEEVTNKWIAFSVARPQSEGVDEYQATVKQWYTLSAGLNPEAPRFVAVDQTRFVHVGLNNKNPMAVCKNQWTDRLAPWQRGARLAQPESPYFRTSE